MHTVFIFTLKVDKRRILEVPILVINRNKQYILPSSYLSAAVNSRDQNRAVTILLT